MWTSGSFGRRRFIAGGLSLPAAALLSSCGRGSDSPSNVRTASAPPSGGGVKAWHDVRALFELDPTITHLSAYIFAPHSRPVREAIARHRAGFDRASRRYVFENEPLEEEAAEAAARHLRTDPELVALTDSTSMGLGLVFSGLQLGEGDEVVVSELDHWVARRSAQYAADRVGATLAEISLYPARAPERATVKQLIAAYEGAIRPATRAVLVTWVHSASGIRMPLREIADVVERANRTRADEDRVLLVVDAAHALGGSPSYVEELGCDVFIAGCHKWLAGPRGTGIVWAKDRAWRRLAPLIPSFRGAGEENPPGVRMTPGGYHSFEHRWALADAFDLHTSIGPDRIAERVDDLSGALREGLRGIEGVTVHAAVEDALRSGVVSFSVRGLDGPETVRRLWDEARVDASVGPYAIQLARLGTCWMNTEAELETALRAVTALA